MSNIVITRTWYAVSLLIFRKLYDVAEGRIFQLLLDGVYAFLRAFLVEECATVGPLHVASISIRSKQYTRINLASTTQPLIDFCVLGSQPLQSKSSLYLPDKFLPMLSGILSVFLINVSEEESSPNEKEWVEIFGILNKVSF